MRLADAETVLTMDYMRLSSIAVIGWVFYEEAVSWSWALGAFLGGHEVAKNTFEVV